MISLLEINIMASLLIILILIIRALFMHKLPPRLFTALWLIAALRLIIPFGVPVPLDFAPAATTIAYVDRLNGNSVKEYYDEISGQTFYKNNITPEDAQQFINIRSVLLFISFAALVIVTVWVTVKHLRTRRRLSDALPCEDAEILSFVQGFGLRREVRVLISEHIISPITFGIIKPVIIIPKEHGDMDIRAAIAHEAAHIEFFDIPYKLLMTAVTVFYWYDPFVWIMLRCVNNDIERACDSFALNYCDGGREAYSALLVGMEEKRSDMLSGSFGSGAVKLRISNIMKSRKTGAAAAFISVLIAACSLSVFASAHTGHRTYYDIYTPTYLSAENDVPQIYMKPQRYFLSGGTANEYIEIFDDMTVQVHGYDPMKEFVEDNMRLYTESEPDATEQELAKYREMLENDEYELLMQRVWKQRNPYRFCGLPYIMIHDAETGESIGTGIQTKDENTLKIGERTYIAEEPWHAGAYAAPDAVMITPSDYLCSDGSVLKIDSANGEYILSDKSGAVIEAGTFRQIHLGSFDGPVLAAVNIDKFPAEQPTGYYFDPECCTLTHSVTGKEYIIRTYPLLS